MPCIPWFLINCPTRGISDFPKIDLFCRCLIPKGLYRDRLGREQGSFIPQGDIHTEGSGSVTLNYSILHGYHRGTLGAFDATYRNSHTSSPIIAARRSAAGMEASNALHQSPQPFSCSDFSCCSSSSFIEVFLQRCFSFCSLTWRILYYGK